MARPPLDYAPPEPVMISRGEADRKAQRAFLQGVILGGLAVGLTFFAGQAFAGGISISGSIVTLAPSDEPGVVAVVVLENVSMNDARDDGLYPLAMDGLAVEVRFLWQADQVTGADRITVIAPGYVCQPANCEATVMEGYSGTVKLLEWVGSSNARSTDDPATELRRVRWGRV